VIYVIPSERKDVEMSSLTSWDKADIRVFDYTGRPDWVNIDKARGEYAWKFQIVEEVIRDFGGLVLWLDAGDMLTKSLEENGLWNTIAGAGVWSTATGTNITT